MNRPRTTATTWIGRILSGWIALFLLMDGVIHVLRIPPVVTAFHQLGMPLSTAFGLGVLELTCLAFYVFPPTSILGALLLTGYLGGAIAIQTRIGNPLFSHVLFPLYVGLFVWGGLYLRDERLRALLPLVEPKRGRTDEPLDATGLQDVLR